MNSKFKSLLAIGMISALAAENGYYGGKNEYISIQKSEPEYKRKKCKSCKHCPSSKYGSKCLSGKWTSQQNQACDKYSKRK